MNRLVRCASLALGIAALAACSIASAAQARAWLDRASMHMGETVTLNVEISGSVGAERPNFDVLSGDFELLGTQSSTSVNIVNGQTDSKLLWAIGLQPRHAGKLTIPAIGIGSVRTEPLTLDVLPAPTGAVGKAGDDIWVQVDATPHTPYVQQEIRITVKLYYAMSLIDGNLEDPKVPGLVVRKLGQDSNYVADVDGRRYRVVERHYAAAAEKSGTLELPPVVFRGRGLDPGEMNSFFSRGRAVSAQSDAIAFDVRARPPQSGSDVWLPAQSLTLSAEGIDPGKDAHVGEPLTLTLRMKAQGLAYEQLPEIDLPSIDGAEIYPDKATTQNRDDGNWVYGQRERKFAIVPSRAGTLSLPAISVAWWDTANDKLRVAEVPAQTLTVLASAPTAAAPSPAAAVPATPAAPMPSALPSPTPITTNDELARWRALALAALLLWVATIAAGLWWWRIRRRRDRRTAILRQPPQPGAGNYNLRSACARGDLPAAARALLRRARRDRPALRNLGELARELGDAGQATLVAELERAIYGAGPGDATLARRIGDAFADGPKFRIAESQAQAAVLPALYPFDLRKRA